ncbi:MAG: outer membrane beta-barrel family protein [Paludibacter sp.]
MNNFSYSTRIFGFLLLICLSVSGLKAEMFEPASIKGCVIEKSSGNPLEFATVIVKNKKDSVINQSVTDKNGWFVFKGIPMGEYRISYSFIGFGKIDSVPVAIKTINQKINLGKLYITEAGQMLNQVEVVGQRSTFVNSIDRKTFNVGQDLMSKSGSVSDLMQNIPSVQVDMDGNVSLRGSENVTILIDGKPSAMMKINRAAVLQQMSAGNVEKIEIITNPSAKYKPDGTSGIINIVMKKDRNLGMNGNVTANVGNEGRWNLNGMLSYNPGKLNLYGSLGVRQDNRSRINDVTTNSYDSISGKFLNYSRTYSKGNSRPVSYIGNVGFDYKLNDLNKFGASISYNYRTYLLNDTTNYVVKDNLLNTTLSYDRPRYRPEWESDLEFKAFYNHKFNKEGHELNFDLTSSITNESEDTHFTNFYYIPAFATTKEHTLYTHQCYDTEFSAEYSLPMGEDCKFEAGYIFQNVSNDLNLIRDTTRTVNPDSWFNDLQRSNRFIRSESTNVLYATYEQEIGRLGFLVGLRAEHTTTRANLVILDSIINNNYFRLYPTIHASYKLAKMHELQLNYSHRIRRPEDEELNPFPEYQDMRNIRAGNPLLLPEDTHSFEFGYQYKNDATTFLSTLYYRNSYNLVTNIIQDLGNAVYKTTLENLSQSQAAGLELILSSGITKFMTFNIATNAFYNTIDASSLGYSSSKSNIAWSANANVNFNLTKSTVWQFTSNYTAETLTPQGKRVPSFVLNSGLKQDLFKKKGALILTVSDIFNSMRYQTEIDIPTMKRIEIRRRSSQTIYLGFTYNFGGSDKKQKDNLKFDNSL